MCTVCCGCEVGRLAEWTDSCTFSIQKSFGLEAAAVQMLPDVAHWQHPIVSCTVLFLRWCQCCPWWLILFTTLLWITMVQSEIEQNFVAVWCRGRKRSVICAKNVKQKIFISLFLPDQPNNQPWLQTQNQRHHQQRQRESISANDTAISVATWSKTSLTRSKASQDNQLYTIIVKSLADASDQKAKQDARDPILRNVLVTLRELCQPAGMINEGTNKGTRVPPLLRKSIFPNAKPTDTLESLVAETATARLEELQRKIVKADEMLPDF